MKWVGQDVRPIDWEAKTSGTEKYSADVQLEGLLFGAITRSTVPFARIRRVDVDAALAIPGVVAVVTEADVAGNPLYVHSGDPFRDRPHLARDHVRYVGEEIAAVAAETAEAARAGARAVRVHYRRKQAPLSVQDALSEKSRALHPRSSGEHNVAFKDARVLGDREAAYASSSSVVHERYVYPRVGHAPMETNATTASWDGDGKLHLWTASQSPWFVAEEMANAFDIPQDWVICHDVSTGGGFGSKSHVSEQEVIAALLAKKAGRPVVLALTREEEFAATKPRHAFYMDLSVHADDSQRIRLVEAKVDADNGAYNHYGPSVLMGGLRKLASMYQPDCVAWEGRLVDTALPPGGQFRGYGSTQTTFALESAVDELATAMDTDPLQLRITNANPSESVARSGIQIGSSGLVACLESVRVAIDWDRKRRERQPMRGVGVAAAMHGSGAYVYEDANKSEIDIWLRPDATADVIFGGADAGTGQRTVIAQAVAEELGIDVSDVRIVMNSSEVFDLGAWSSRGTHMSLHAAQQTAGEIGSVLRSEAAAKLGTEPDDVVLGGGRASADSDSVEITDLVGIVGNDEGYRHRGAYVDPVMQRIGSGSDNYSASYSFAAHAVEVEVDPGTGQIKILNYVAAHDVGRAINPTMVRGQISGGVMQGLGAALGEEVLYEAGRMVNPTFLNYPLPRSIEAPAVDVIVLDGFDAAGPYGAKSVGEIPILPVGPAVANAVYDATGIRFRELPLSPDKVLAALRRRDGEGIEPRSLWRRPGRWQIELFRRAYPLGLKQVLRQTSRFAKPREMPARTEVRTVHEIKDVHTGRGEGSVLMAGGTDVLPRRQQGLETASTLISIGSISALRRCVTRSDGWTELGAALTLRELAERRDLIPQIVRDTAKEIATPLIREQATLAGSLLQEKRCWFYRNGFNCYKRGGTLCPCYAVTGDHRFQHAVIDAHRCQAVTPADLATTLLACDALVEYERSDGARHRSTIKDLYVGPGETSLPSDGLVIAVHLPPGMRERKGAFRKLAMWEGDFAVASVAITATVERGALADTRIALGAMAPTPIRLPDVEAALNRAARHDVVDQGTIAFRRTIGRLAHPLPRNKWKMDASVGVFREALQVICDQSAERSGKLQEGGLDPIAL
jgi:CO/xanthine dehydrogenase Mo-binding subunit/CO/xanthine dehydrogenase FAD-binding subunit